MRYPLRAASTYDRQAPCWCGNGNLGQSSSSGNDFPRVQFGVKAPDGSARGGIRTPLRPGAAFACSA